MLIFLLFSDQISRGQVSGENCLRGAPPFEESQTVRTRKIETTFHKTGCLVSYGKGKIQKQADRFLIV